MNSLATWSLLCFLIALTLFGVEIFVPSGGMLGILAIIAAIGGIVFLFQINTTLGLIGSIVCIASIPVLIMVAMKLMPSTPIGRLLIFKEPQSSDNDESSNEDADPTSPSTENKPHQLINKIGIAQTDLRPVGVCRIDGHKEPCSAVTGLISAGTTIKVVAIVDGHLKVQAVED
jgi:membrane-bound ClpP family serine protease